MFDNVRERLEVLRKLGWRPGYDGHSSTLDHSKINDVVTEVIRWRDERPKPRLRHYLIRAYRRVVLPRKDWRLPWR